MNLLSKYFKGLLKPIPEKKKMPQDLITAKEKQAIIIKSYLKPTLKQYGYLTNGQTWWKERKDFFIIINLQNYSWNNKNNVNFCFNIGIALKSLMKDLSKNPTHFDLTVPLRQDFYLPDSRKSHCYRNKTGYIIDQETAVDDFIKELRIDFESEILPRLDNLFIIDDCLRYYEHLPFFGERLKMLVNSSR